MKLTFIDKVGSLGALLSAMACPVCWPLFATLGSSIGLGVLAPWEGVISNYVFPLFVLVAVVGGVISFRAHKQPLPLIVEIVSGLLIIFGIYASWQPTFVYIGIFGLLLSSTLGYFALKREEKLCLN
ncbi:MAG: hypothetical protein COA78_34445 [Blastopirellula sp.]|nr:MAG: hypothetical protein COA78_34445 [Blastopirellula sp.]